MVVICSPAAVRSRWVNEEILAFKRLGRSGRIFCFIVDGNPNAGDETECFPAAIRFECTETGDAVLCRCLNCSNTVPRFANLSRFGEADLASGDMRPESECLRIRLADRGL